jgi:glucose/arabinose dehydrogenase
MNMQATNHGVQRDRSIGVTLMLLAFLSACAASSSPSSLAGTVTAPATTRTVRQQPTLAIATVLPTAHTPASALPADTPVTVPPGYRAEIYAQGIAQPTALTLGPGGYLYVTQLSGEVVIVEGPSAVPRVYISGLERPLGLVWRGADLYVLSQGTLSVFPNSGVTPGKRRDLLTNIPTAGMQNNNLVLGQDDWLYLGIGSLCDHYRPDNPISGQIRRIRPDGSGWQTYATGLRNPFGLTVGPDGTLWATDNGREGLPPGLPPEELNRIVGGGDYGWPRCYGDRVPDPQGGGNATNCAATMAPVATFSAHWSPVGLAFYTGGRFGPEDNGALFVGMAGAWDRSPDHGRRIVRVRLRDEAPAETTDWSTGWGRPISLLTAPDGALLVADLDRGTITRIVWSR